MYGLIQRGRPKARSLPQQLVDAGLGAGLRVDRLHDHRAIERWAGRAVGQRFAGQRALILDVEAMKVLREELIESFGVAAAQTLLTQFGFAQGWRKELALFRK